MFGFKLIESEYLLSDVFKNSLHVNTFIAFNTQANKFYFTLNC